MAECNSNKTNNIYPNFNTIPLNDEQKFRLNKIYEIKDYFVAEIKELMRVKRVNEQKTQ